MYTLIFILIILSLLNKKKNNNNNKYRSMVIHLHNMRERKICVYFM